MWHKIRRLFWPAGEPEPQLEDVEFVHRMKAARRYGIEHKHASLRSQREMKQAQVNRVERAYMHKQWEGRDE